MKTCHFCMKKVELQSTRCPHCTQEFDVFTGYPSGYYSRPTGLDQTPVSPAAVLLVFLGLLLSYSTDDGVWFWIAIATAIVAQIKRSG